VDGDGYAPGFAHSAGHGPRERACSARIARRRCPVWTSNHSTHRKKPPRCAPPPPRRTTATTTTRSPRPTLPSRSHPLRRRRDVRETPPAASAPTLAPEAIARMRGWPSDAAHAAALPRTPGIAPSPTHTRRKTPRPPRSPRNARIVRPIASSSLRRGWTRDAFNGTLTHGGRVLRRVRHEGPGVQTRAFTFSDHRVLRRQRPRWR